MLHGGRCSVEGAIRERSPRTGTESACNSPICRGSAKSFPTSRRPPTGTRQKPRSSEGGCSIGLVHREPTTGVVAARSKSLLRRGGQTVADVLAPTLYSVLGFKFDAHNGPVSRGSTTKPCSCSRANANASERADGQDGSDVPLRHGARCADHVMQHRHDHSDQPTSRRAGAPAWPNSANPLRYRRREPTSRMTKSAIGSRHVRRARAPGLKAPASADDGAPPTRDQMARLTRRASCRTRFNEKAARRLSGDYRLSPLGQCSVSRPNSDPNAPRGPKDDRCDCGAIVSRSTERCRICLETSNQFEAVSETAAWIRFDVLGSQAQSSGLRSDLGTVVRCAGRR